jgi:hypothetical protein
MTKPNFILKRTKLLFQSNDEVNKQLVLNEYNKKRDLQPLKKKDCYCGHTINCDCSNPSFEEFTHNLLNNNIEENDLFNPRLGY